MLGSAVGDAEMVNMNSTESGAFKRTKFRDIDPTVEYNFRVCTLINGKTISRKLLTLKPKIQAKENELDME